MKPVQSRRNFLKGLAAGGALIGATLTGCRRVSKEIMDEHMPVKREIPLDKMSYRINHNTGDSVSLLGYGMMRLPVKSKVTPGQSDIDQDAVNELVDYALEHGVNYFDTSPVYCKGFSEQATGTALSRHPRNSYFIATKLSNFAESTWPREESIKMFEESLKELKTDYVDYLLLHAVGKSMEELQGRYFDNGILQWLVAQKEAGRIRNLGFSFHGDHKVFDHLLAMHDRDEVHWDFVQIQHNYSDWLNPDGLDKKSEYLYGELEKRNIPVVVMEPLLGGRLSRLPKHLVAEFKSRRPDDSVASWAFRFAGTQPGILTVLSGMTYMEHLQDNVLTYSPLDPCTDEEVDMLMHSADLLRTYPTIPCTKCQYCMPCPYGINIPAIFEFYNKNVDDGNVVTSSNDENYAQVRKEFLIDYDRTIPEPRQASHCIECGNCLSHCPQQINIPTRLRQIDDYVEKLKQQTF